MVVSVCGVARPDHGDRYRASCLDDGQENVRRSAAQLNEPGARLVCSFLLRNRGSLEEGVVQAKLALETDPLSSYANGMVGFACCAAGRYDEAVRGM